MSPRMQVVQLLTTKKKKRGMIYVDTNSHESFGFQILIKLWLIVLLDRRYIVILLQSSLIVKYNRLIK